jgi:uncharacterized protein YndB with AHSA1/START domain
MSETLSEPALTPAKFVHLGEFIQAELRLILDNHVEEVWAALTRADRLPQWLAPGHIDLRPGGAVRLDFADSGIVIDSAVTAIEPQRLLEYSWSGPGEPKRPVRWTLEPIGAATDLTLTLTLPAEDDAGRSAAGWAAHLDMLAAALAGVPIKFPFELFKAARDQYRAELAG